MTHFARSIEDARRHAKAGPVLAGIAARVERRTGQVQPLVFRNLSYTPFTDLLQRNRIPADFAIRPAARECAMQAAPSGVCAG